MEDGRRFKKDTAENSCKALCWKLTTTDITDDVTVSHIPCTTLRLSSESCAHAVNDSLTFSVYFSLYFT